MQADIDRARSARRVYSAMLACMLAAGLALALLGGGAALLLCLIGLLLGALLVANLWLDAPVRSAPPSTLTEI